MGKNLLIELFAQNDDVFKVLPAAVARGPAVVPNLRFAQESEPCHMDDPCSSELIVGSEEDCGAENSFEGANQPSIFFAALVHSEGLKHFRAALEADRLAPLPDGERGQENRHDSVLPERDTVAGMPSHLKHEVPVPPLEKKLIRRRPTDRQAAKNKRSGAESEILLSLIPIQSDQMDSIELPEYLSRNLEMETGRLRVGQRSTSRVSPRGRRTRFLRNDESGFSLVSQDRRLPNFCPIASE